MGKDRESLHEDIYYIPVLLTTMYWAYLVFPYMQSPLAYFHCERKQIHMSTSIVLSDKRRSSRIRNENF
jgi:hypothetical protein